MKITAFKRSIACILALLSSLNFTPFNFDMVSQWLAGPEYSEASSQQKADMLLDLYINQDYIYLSKDAEKFTRTVLSQMLIELESSEGDSRKIINAIDSLPKYERGARNTERKTFTPDKEENIRKKMSLKRLIKYSLLPEDVKNGFYYFTDGINDVYIYLIYTKYDGVYELAGDFITDSGIIVADSSGVYYDSRSKLIYGVYDDGMLQLGFDFNPKGITMQNPVHPWQRDFGYGVGYDILGSIFIMKTDTVRVRFDYNGEKMMIQFWKGNYTKASNGTEIGVYKRKPLSLSRYDSVSDDEMLYMSMKLYHGDDLIFENDRELHWWLTSYQPGERFAPSELTLDCHIEAADKEMRDAFMEAADKAFGDDATITNKGLDVHIIWC